MGAASLVGRVGGLAVALGVGAAMSTSVAFADGAGESAGPSAASDSTGGAASRAQPTASAATDPAPATKSRSPKGPRPSKAEPARDGQVSSSGGALTSGKARDTDPDAVTDRRRHRADADPEDTDTTNTVANNAAPKPKAQRSHVGTRHADVVAGTPPVPPRRTPAPRVRETVKVSEAAKVTKSAEPAALLVPRALATPSVTDTVLAPSGDLIPVALAEPMKPAVKEPIQTRIVSGLLAAVGLAPAATNSPVAPAESPALLVMLAWARRESERTADPAGQVASVAAVGPVATALAIEPAAAAVAVDPKVQTPQPAKPAAGTTSKLDWVTGLGITTGTNGTPGAYGIRGTDLGIMWDDGKGNVLMLFGDTFDGANMTGVWRSNVLVRSVDHNLADGDLGIKDAVISPGGNYNLNEWSNKYGATQVVRDPGFLGLFGKTVTIIPTAAISVTDANGKTTQYANVMSVRSWDNPGSWTTNWSAIATSTDDGLSWTVNRNTVRSAGWLRSSVSYQSGGQNFQQGAFVMGQATDLDARGVQYVYSYGTPSGRNGYAYVSRVAVDQIVNLGAYEYWSGDGKGWVRNKPASAVSVLGGPSQEPGFTGWIQRLFGLNKSTVSELSVQYNDYLGQYVALYTDSSNNVVMRTSDSPQGMWSDPTTLVANNLTTNTGMYAPMIHPWSGTDQLGANNNQYLYWNLSWWGSYNVRLMQTDLSPMAPAGSSAGTILV